MCFAFLSAILVSVLLAGREILGAEDDASRRTAVCITGQPRSLKLALNSEKVIHNFFTKQYRYYSSTVADTIINFLAHTVAQQGVDVFMITPSDTAIVMSNAEKEELCASLYNFHLFHKTHPMKNQLFCRVMQEEEIYDYFADEVPHVEMFRDGKAGSSEYQHGLTKNHTFRIAKEKYFRQIWDLQYCNNVIKQHAANVGIKYEYKMRLRPDVAFFPGTYLSRGDDIGKSSKYERYKTFRDENGIASGSSCNSSILITDYISHPGGNQDTFAFGLAKDMDLRFNLYDAILKEGLLTDFYEHLGRTGIRQQFTSETVLEYYLYVHGICLQSDPHIRAGVIRENTYSPYDAYAFPSGKIKTLDATHVSLGKISEEGFSRWINMNSIREPIIPFHNGDLLRFGKAARAIYVYENATLRVIKSMDIFYVYGFKIEDVRDIEPHWKEALAEGPPFKIPRRQYENRNNVTKVLRTALEIE